LKKTGASKILLLCFKMITIALFHSTIRADEKLIIQAAKKRKIKIKLVDIRKEIFNPDTYKVDFELALERSVSTVKGNYAVKFLESLSIPVVNSIALSAICEDKFLTSLTLKQAGISTPDFAMVFDIEGAKQAVEQLGGFPVIVKSPLGSWGRLLAKVNDYDALEALIEHKQVLGSPYQKAFYFQEYVKKPGRDIRAFVMGGETICAIYRDSPHWITNTARGGKASNCPVDKDLSEICQQASEAIGRGILAMDVLETPDGLKINEINHTIEFKNSEKPTGVSISEAVIDYCLEQIKKIRLCPKAN